MSRNRPQASGFSSGLSLLPLMFPSSHVSDLPAISHNTPCEKEVAGDTLFPDNPLGGQNNDLLLYGKSECQHNALSAGSVRAQGVWTGHR